jgi:Ni/Co efflux regulator RcnB
MKKLIIILIAALSFNAVSAQNRNASYSDRHQATQVRDNWNNNQDRSRDYAYNNNGRRNDQNNRQAEYDHMNQQYDQRISGYRNDRSLNSYERQRRINDAEKERQQKVKSFGTGVVIGGLAAILLGAIIGN